MNKFIWLLVRLLSVAVIVINLIYIKTHAAPNLNSYIAFVKPYFVYMLLGIILGSLFLFLTRMLSSSIAVLVLLIILVVMLIVYQPYVMRLFHFIS